jgi:subtilisin family serine protease
MFNSTQSEFLSIERLRMAKKERASSEDKGFKLNKAARGRCDPGILRLLLMKEADIIAAKTNDEKRLKSHVKALKKVRKTAPSKTSKKPFPSKIATSPHPIFGPVHIETPKRKKRIVKIRAIVNFAGNADDLRNMGITVHSSVQNIFTIRATRSQLVTLVSQAATQKVSLPRLLYPVLQDAVPTAEIDQIHQVGSSGNGIIVGIVDSTLHVKHHAFRDPNGTNGTRVRYMWVQDPDSSSAPGQSPEAYSQDVVNHPGSPDFTGLNYGIIYDEAAINTALGFTNPYGTGANHIAKQPSATDPEHGTHVAGIAAGSGHLDNWSDTPVNVGAAPLADIVHVCYRLSIANVQSGVFEDDIINGLNFILIIAARNGQPVVINNSYGGNLGPHNGQTDFDQARNAMLDSFLGRSLVYAAGNDNAIYDLGVGRYVDTKGYRKGAVSAGTTETFTFTPNYTDDWLEIWYTGPDLDIRIDHGTHNTGWNTPPNGLQTTVDAVSVTIDRDTQASTGMKNIRVYFSNVSFIDAWTINLRNNNTSTGADYRAWTCLQGHWADLSGYTVDEMTLSDTSCARAILTVGSCAKQVSGNVEAIAEYSGRGPTLDGRIKPEITAVGGTYSREIMSANSLTTGGYVGMNGTSMAAPLVAGAVALLFENSSDLNQDAIKGLLTQTADRTNLDIDPMASTYDPKERNAFGFGRLRMLAPFQHSLPLVDVDVWVKKAEDDFGFQPYPGDCFCHAPEVTIIDKNGAETTTLDWKEEYTIKVKIHNLGDTPAIKTKVQIKYTRPWAAPDTWAPCTDSTGTAITQETNVAALGDVDLTFNQKWQPKQGEVPTADVDWGEHYCLLVELDDPPNDPLKFDQSSTSGGEAWKRNIKGTNNVALRNLAIK